MKRRRGFTLIELVVVIAILGILAGILIPKMLTTRKMARMNANRNNLQSVKASLEQYYSKNEHYPVSSGGIAQLDSSLTQGSDDGVRYLERLPKYQGQNDNIINSYSTASSEGNKPQNYTIHLNDDVQTDKDERTFTIDKDTNPSDLYK